MKPKVKSLISLLDSTPNVIFNPHAVTQNLHVDGRRFTVKQESYMLEVKRHNNSEVCAHNGIGCMDTKTFNIPEAAAL